MTNSSCILVAMVAIAALLVIGTETIRSGHDGMAFADKNRDINVQTSTTQDQGCEPAGGTPGITNACIATSGSGSTQMQVTLNFNSCIAVGSPPELQCTGPIPPNNCNNLGCQSVTCDFSVFGASGNCTTDSGVQLTSCTHPIEPGPLTCTRTEPGTGITNSGGVTGGDSG